MTDWSDALARAFQQHLFEIGGSGGSAGSHRRFDKPCSGIASRDPGTRSSNAVVLGVHKTNPPGASVNPRTTVTTAPSTMVPGQAWHEYTLVDGI